MPGIRPALDEDGRGSWCLVRWGRHMSKKSKDDIALDKLLEAATNTMDGARCTVVIEGEECTNQALMAVAFFLGEYSAHMVGCAEHVPQLTQFAALAAKTFMDAQERWRQEQEARWYGKST